MMRLLICAGFLPIFAIAMYYLFEDSQLHTHAPDNRTSISEEKANRVPFAARRAPLSPDKSEKRGVMDAMARVQHEVNKKNLDDSMAKAAAATTEADQREMVNFQMRKREPHYNELFQSWGLNRKKIEEVLRVIYSREEKLTALRLEAFRNGVDYALTAQEKIKAEREIVNVYLLTLLEKDQYNEFLKLDSQLNSDSSRKNASPD